MNSDERAIRVALGLEKDFSVDRGRYQKPADVMHKGKKYSVLSKVTHYTIKNSGKKVIEYEYQAAGPFSAIITKRLEKHTVKCFDNNGVEISNNTCTSYGYIPQNVRRALDAAVDEFCYFRNAAVWQYLRQR